MNTMKSLQDEIEEYGQDLENLDKALKRNADAVSDGMRNMMSELSKKHELIKEKSIAMAEDGNETISLVQNGIDSTWADFKNGLVALKSTMRGMT
jgi:conjugal transfer/entry exclusion protein